jgi:hypothetical protein
VGTVNQRDQAQAKTLAGQRADLQDGSESPAGFDDKFIPFPE